MVDIGLYLAYALLIIAMLSAVLFPAVYMLRHLEEARKVLIGIGVIIVIAVISYFTASGDFYFPGIENKMNYSQQAVKLIGAGINMTIFMGALAIITAVFFEVKNAFN
ncbi:MAG: hypothetical protein KatS3mg031_2224 [Chitinophagales bacterium]|nr:MAG: hypothetical protein KatS3mg031_2224 [Chitinophagales bacterium]